MLDLVILFGIISVIIFTIISVGMAESSSGGSPEKNKYIMQDKAEDSVFYFSNYGLKSSKAYEEPIASTYDGDSKTHYQEDPFSGGALGDLVVELGPPLPPGYKEVKIIKGETGSQGPPGKDAISKDGIDGIGKDGKDGKDGIGKDGKDGIGKDGKDFIGGDDDSAEDKFKKYFSGGGTFIYAPKNNGNIATQGYASATGNQANDEGKVYAQATGHVFEGGMPVSSTGELGNYSITAENLAGHVTNNHQGAEPQGIASDSQTIYGHHQETFIPSKKVESERN